MHKLKNCYINTNQMLPKHELFSTSIFCCFSMSFSLFVVLFDLISSLLINVHSKVIISNKQYGILHIKDLRLDLSIPLMLKLMVYPTHLSYAYALRTVIYIPSHRTEQSSYSRRYNKYDFSKILICKYP